MEEELELVCGPSGAGQSVFPSEEARQAAWEVHRSELLTNAEGRRPWAWWRYDVPELRDPTISETVQLEGLGQITAEERERLAAVGRGSALRGALPEVIE